MTESFCLVEVWEGIDHEANTKMRGSKYKMTYVRLHIHINNCVTPDSVLLALIAQQLFEEDIP